RRVGRERHADLELAGHEDGNRDRVVAVLEKPAGGSPVVAPLLAQEVDDERRVEMDYHQPGARGRLFFRSVTMESTMSSVCSDSGSIRRTAARNSRPDIGPAKRSLMTSEKDCPARL